MERIFWVVNGDLDEVNYWLQKGGRVKTILPVAEPISTYACSGGQYDSYTYGSYEGNIYTYVVVEFD